MKGQPWSDLLNAVNSFIETRKNKTQNKGEKDILSIVLYSRTARVHCEATMITSDPHKNIAYGTAVGTRFCEGIKKSSEIISRTNWDKYSPVLLFLSDGQCKTGVNEMKLLKNNYGNKGLIVHTIGFGKKCFSSQLEELARVGGGSYHFSSTGFELQTVFVEVASTMAPVVSLSSTIN